MSNFEQNSQENVREHFFCYRKCPWMSLVKKISPMLKRFSDMRAVEEAMWLWKQFNILLKFSTDNLKNVYAGKVFSLLVSNHSMYQQAGTGSRSRSRGRSRRESVNSDSRKNKNKKNSNAKSRIEIKCSDINVNFKANLFAYRLLFWLDRSFLLN